MARRLTRCQSRPNGLCFAALNEALSETDATSSAAARTALPRTDQSASVANREACASMKGIPWTVPSAAKMPNLVVGQWMTSYGIDQARGLRAVERNKNPKARVSPKVF